MKKTKLVFLSGVLVILAVAAVLYIMSGERLTSRSARVVGPTAVVHARLAGTVAEVYVSPGALAAAGSSLFVLNRDELALQLAREQSALLELSAAIPPERRKRVMQDLGLNSNEPDLEDELRRARGAEQDAQRTLNAASTRHSQTSVALLRLRSSASTASKAALDKAAQAEREAKAALDSAYALQEKTSTARAGLEAQLAARRRMAQEGALDPSVMEARVSMYRQQLVKVAQAQQNLEMAEEKAPFDGYVRNVLIAPGTAVYKGQEAMIIDPADPDLLWVEAVYPVEQSKGIKPGMFCEIELETAKGEAGPDGQAAPVSEAAGAAAPAKGKILFAGSVLDEPKVASLSKSGDTEAFVRIAFAKPLNPGMPAPRHGQNAKVTIFTDKIVPPTPGRAPAGPADGSAKGGGAS